MAIVQRCLVVDDSPVRHRRFQKILMATGVKQIRHAFTAQEAITALGHSVLSDMPFRMLCLDHDLGTFDDGRTVANWLVEVSGYSRDLKVLIHSQNPSGAQAIEDILRAGGFTEVKQTPFKSA